MKKQKKMALGPLLWDQEELISEKNEYKKSRETVPLRQIFLALNGLFICMKMHIFFRRCASYVPFYLTNFIYTVHSILKWEFLKFGNQHQQIPWYFLFSNMGRIYMIYIEKL